MGFFRRLGARGRRDIVSCSAGIDPVLGKAAEHAISAGRYRIYGADPDGNAVFLATGEPNLIVTVQRRPLASGKAHAMVILSVEPVRADAHELHEHLDPLWDTRPKE
jgi:hypothetical protein